MMRTEAVHDCPLCGGSGNILYDQVKDRLFGVSGHWSVRQCENSACGLFWLDPVPIQDDIALAYENYYTHGESITRSGTFRRMYDWIVQGYFASRYGVKNVTGMQFILGYLLYFFPGKRAESDYKIASLTPVHDGHLLEIGCGSGAVLTQLSNLGWLVTGVELDKKSVELGQLRGLDVRLGALHEQHFRSNSYDVIVMNHVIEHLHRPLDTLNECWRILRDGGRLVIVTPNTASMLHRIFKSHWMHLDAPRHLHLFSPVSLKLLVRNAGFHLDSCKTSIRDANGVFEGSFEIRQNGSHDMRTKRSPLLRAIGRLIQYVEFIVIKVLPSVGEEIVLIARKI